MKVLVPVDGSPHSLKAVEAACELVSSRPPSELILLSVSLALFDLEDEGHYVADKLKRQAEASLTQGKEKAKAMGVTPIMALLAIGVSAADEIVRVSKDEKVDLIVIGSRGLAGKTRFFVGGTATKVVTYSPCSVMVVKIPEEEAS